MQQCTNE